MEIFLMICGIIATLGMYAVIILLILKIGRKNASKTLHTYISPIDYLSGKSEIRLAELHKQLTAEGYILDGFDVYPRFSNPQNL